MIGLKKLRIVMAILAAVVLGVGTASANLIVNGDFEAGDSGFTSAYSLCRPGLLRLIQLGKVFGMKEHMASGLTPSHIIHYGPVLEITLRVPGI